MLESHRDGLKQNVLNLKDKPNDQIGDALVHWTTARAEQLKQI